MDATVAAELDVVIVSHGGASLLRDCLHSLRQHPASGVSTTITVVDNASGDSTPAMVRTEFPEVRLVESPDNLGFAAATNLGILVSSGDYVLALNPDTRVTAGALDHMVALMEAHPQVGICGCRLQFEDGRFDHAARRSFPTLLGALGHFTGIGRSETAPAPLAQYRAPGVHSGPTDAVSGAFMLIRRAALEEVGLFDERYWMYMEDLDLCFRFARAGWRTWYDPGASVVHIKGGTTGRARSLRLNRAFHQGMYRFYREYYAPRRSPLVNGAVYGAIAGKFAVSAARSALSRLLAPSERPMPVVLQRRAGEHAAASVDEMSPAA